MMVQDLIYDGYDKGLNNLQQSISNVFTEPLVFSKHLAESIANTVSPDEAQRTVSLLSKPSLNFSSQISNFIRQSQLVVGAGFIAAPRAVDTDERYILWLQRRSKEILRLRLNFDLHDALSYDYVQREWYTYTRSTFAPALTGPYLDYGGAHRLVITVTNPLVLHGRFMGITAVDLCGREIETLVSKLLCRLRVDAVLVNRDNSVIASNSPNWMPGERLGKFDVKATVFQPKHTAHISDWTSAVIKTFNF